MNALSQEVAYQTDAEAAQACAKGFSGTTRENLGGLHLRLQLIEALAGRIPVFVASRLRTYALRSAGFRIERSVILWGLPSIIGSGDIYSRLTVGAATGFNVRCLLELEAPITIGERVGVGHSVMFLTSSYELGSADQRASTVVRAPIVIGNGAWLGARCTIMPGVTVGAGAVIGAGTVVSKDVAPNTLIMGAQRLPLDRWRP